MYHNCIKETQNKDLLEILILETRKIAVVNLFKYSCTQKGAWH